MTLETRPLNWIVDKDFIKDNIVVRISKTDNFRPRYSYSIGRINEQGNLVSYFGVYIDVEEGEAKIKKAISNDIFLLVAEAEAYIESCAKMREDEILAQRIDSDEKFTVKGKSVKHTGKTAKEKAKKIKEKKLKEKLVNE